MIIFVRLTYDKTVFITVQQILLTTIKRKSYYNCYTKDILSYLK